MNLIGIFVPKIILLLGIWIPNYDLNCKLLLTAICGCKLIWDFDRSRPGNSGVSYRLTSFLSGGVQDFLISAVCLCISLAFEYVAFRNSAWIPTILGMISVAFSLFEILGSIKMALPDKKSKPASPRINTPQSGGTQPQVRPRPPVSTVPLVPILPIGYKRQMVPPASVIVPLAKIKESFRQAENKYYKKRFSILGDSISTLDGFNPAGFNVFYTGENCTKLGVGRFEDTWWGQIIDFFGGELLVNNSWSGSRVSRMPNADGLFPSGCSDERTGNLHVNDTVPDVIIVYLGTNDWGYGVSPEPKRVVFFDEKTGMHVDGMETPNESVFSYAYGLMIKKLRVNYPDAEIWCCTLSTTRISANKNFVFPYSVSGMDIRIYNDVIKRTARSYDCKLIDLFKYNIPYDTVDGTHPNAEGMKTVADMVVNCIAKDNSEIPATIYSACDFEGSIIGGKYRMQRCVANGGSSSTFWATDLRNDKMFIIKVVESSGPLANAWDDLRETFVAKTKLGHPAIPNAEEVIDTEHFTCLVSEYLQGQTLDVAIKERGVVDFATLIDWSLQLCDAVGYLHSQRTPILLRDLCPSNILLQSDGKLRLLNLEAMIHDSLSPDHGGAYPWHPGLAAPERFAGKGDVRSDIFTLGMIMHYLATGVDASQPPYQLGPIREYRPDLPTWFEKIVAKCIEIDPDKRFQNCEEVKMCLSRK